MSGYGCRSVTCVAVCCSCVLQCVVVLCSVESPLCWLRMPVYYTCCSVLQYTQLYIHDTCIYENKCTEVASLHQKQVSVIIDIYIFVCVYMYMCLYGSTNVYKSTHILSPTLTFSLSASCARAFSLPPPTHTLTHTHMNIYTHTHIHTHTHTHTRTHPHIIHHTHNTHTSTVNAGGEASKSEETTVRVQQQLSQVHCT